MIRVLSRCLLGFLLALSLAANLPTFADEAADRLALAVDALTRLQGVDLGSNPAMNERVLKVLEKTRGTPGFVRLVRHFDIPGQEAGLIEVAAAFPKEESGVDAARLLLVRGKLDSLASSLVLDGARAVAIAEAVGNTGHRDSTGLLLPLLSSAKTGVELRKQAARSLARTVDGASNLLALAKSGRLPGELNDLAFTELTQVRWEAIKTEAAKMRGQSVVTFPPLAELLKLTGDPRNGERIYKRASPGCINCHVIKGQGTDLGPNLSEIGSKLEKEALFQSILEPSAGISFGFEAFTLTLKDGDEAYGLIASETADELAVKAVGGVVARYRKSAIASRQKSSVSIMPSGLEAGMTPQELADLVEYLVSLKKVD